MPTVFIPRRADILELARPWTFTLEAVPQNSAAWVGFGLHLKHPDVMKETDLAPDRRRRIAWSARHAGHKKERVTLPAGVRLFVRRLRVESWWQHAKGYGQDELGVWIRKQDNGGLLSWSGKFVVLLDDVNGLEVR